MIQLNPASLDSENNILDSKIPIKKSLNKTVKNKNVSFDSSSENESRPKTKITNLNNLLSKLHNNNEDEDNEYKNYRDNLVTNNVNQDLNQDLNQDINRLQESRNNNLNMNPNLNMHPDLSQAQNPVQNQQRVSNNSFGDYSNYDDGYKLNYNMLNTQNSTILNNNELVQKLDYIVHLLEEQHNEKTNHISEELILYLFLGIFILFVLDSFAKASKYIR